MPDSDTSAPRVVDRVIESIESLRSTAPFFAPLRIRLSYRGFSAIVNEAAPPAPSGTLAQLGGGFAGLEQEQWQYREEWLRNAFEAWGKEGNLLWGYPVVCDPQFEREYSVEVVK